MIDGSGLHECLQQQSSTCPGSNGHLTISATKAVFNKLVSIVRSIPYCTHLTTDE